MLNTIRELKAYRLSLNLIAIEKEITCLKARKNVLKHDVDIQIAELEATKVLKAAKLLRLADKLGMDLDNIQKEEQD